MIGSLHLAALGSCANPRPRAGTLSSVEARRMEEYRHLISLQHDYDMAVIALQKALEKARREEERLQAEAARERVNEARIRNEVPKWFECALEVGATPACEYIARRLLEVDKTVAAPSCAGVIEYLRTGDKREAVFAAGQAWLDEAKGSSDIEKAGSLLAEWAICMLF